MTTVKNLSDLCDLWGEEPPGLSHRLYKDTDCGAHLTFHMADGSALYAGNADRATLTRAAPVVGITIGSIVEGSEVCIDGNRLDFPFTEETLNAAVKNVEEQADFYWERDNHDWFTVRRAFAPDRDVVTGGSIGANGFCLEGKDGLTEREVAEIQAGVEAWSAEATLTPGEMRKVGCFVVEVYDRGMDTF